MPSAFAKEMQIETAPKAQQFHFAAIDGLRGVAILMVFALHFWAIDPHGPFLFGVFAEFGRCGVSIFFAISGFCLFSSVASGRKLIQWGNWYRRRMARLTIPYAVALIICASFTGATIADIICHLSFAHPFFSEKIFGVDVSFWFLGTLVHLYLIFPILAYAMCRSPKFTLFATASISLLWQWTVAQIAEPSSIIYMQWTKLFPGRLFEFTVGMFAAYLAARPFQHRVFGFLALGGIGFFAGPFLHRLALPGNNWWWGDILFAPCWGALVYAAATYQVSLPLRSVIFAPIRGLGLISYSLYLYNWVMALFQDRLIGLAVATGCGIFAYFLFERASVSRTR